MRQQQRVAHARQELLLPRRLLRSCVAHWCGCSRVRCAERPPMIWFHIFTYLGCVDDAKNALRAAGVWDGVADTLPGMPRCAITVCHGGSMATYIHADRTLVLLATGAVAAASGDAAMAKQRLTKALKLAHARLCNHLLVWQVLLVLAPLQAGQSDVAGAQSMLDSARTLSTSAQFVPGQVRVVCVPRLLPTDV